jgi:hypothetical protein
MAIKAFSPGRQAFESAGMALNQVSETQQFSSAGMGSVW